MKTLLLILLLVPMMSFGQAPESFNYQAVVRDAGGLILNNQSVGLKLTIQLGSIGGPAVYTETFASTTNDYGIVNLEIGTGTSTDDFTIIDWANGPFFMETAVDVSGGTNYSVMGTSQLMSVPYALYAKTSGNGEGPAGTDGVDGQDGIDGAQGPEGPQGATGNNGINGAPGLQGPIGPAGDDGIDGDDGIQGLTGATGPQGATGNNGIDGIDGQDGAQGIQGLTGSNGPQGPAGTDGVDGQDGIGAQGPEGPQGATGNNGINGAPGLQGPIGPAGDDGIDGDDGIQGLTGSTGPQGNQGIQGPAGDDGIDGDDGIQGLTGATGPQGATGTNGINGAPGLQGPIGPAGDDGIDGQDGPQGAQGIQGAQGAQGAQGDTGATGQQGIQGNTGAQGLTGADGQYGIDGNGISQVIENGDGTFTFQFTDGTDYVTSNLNGNGIEMITENGDGTLTFQFTDGTSYTTINLIGNGIDWIDQNPDGTLTINLTDGTSFITTNIIGNGIDFIIENGDGTLTIQFTNGTSFTTSDLTGNDGVGITNTTDNGDGTFTFTYSDGNTFTTSNLIGPAGVVDYDSLANIITVDSSFTANINANISSSINSFPNNITSYLVCSDLSCVTNLLSLGYVPLGGVSVDESQGGASGQYNSINWRQAMVIYIGSPSIIDYYVATSESEVNTKISQGYMPYGKISYSESRAGASGQFYSNSTYQALVKYNTNSNSNGNAATESFYYPDTDGDGYGSDNNWVWAVNAPPGYISDNTDCDDNDAAVYPGATDIFDGIDNNCDGQIDEGVGPAIGDTYQGGIVFYLDGNGGGLIAAPTDQSSGAQWGCYGTPISGADGTAIGTGAQNTIDIESGCSTPGTAADICANLVLSGYTDWFLPSKDELNLMYQNIGPAGNALNVGGFADSYYWSSTEDDSDYAWLQYFSGGYQDNDYKNDSNGLVRSVRAF